MTITENDRWSTSLFFHNWRLEFGNKLFLCFRNIFLTLNYNSKFHPHIQSHSNNKSRLSQYSFIFSFISCFCVQEKLFVEEFYFITKFFVQITREKFKFSCHRVYERICFREVHVLMMPICLQLLQLRRA